MKITARNLAAALSYLGADVESAFLELAAASTALDANVRVALYPTQEPAKLRSIATRGETQLLFVEHNCSKHICAMHAADQICLMLDDADLVMYLTSKFPEYNVEELL